MKNKIILALLIASACTLNHADQKKPRLTVIMVVDQFAYNYLPKLSCYLRHGIKYLMQHGIVYQHANYPHAAPSTGPGHTALNTGCYAKDHGIISNNWADRNGNKIGCDDESVKTAAVLNPRGGVYDYGKGPCNIMVDGITDQFVMNSEPGANRAAISISLKSRSAICTANKLGKAFWLDTKTGFFTSSRAYYNELPQWIKSFNRAKGINRLSQVSWRLFFPRNYFAYDFKDIDNYEFSSRDSIAGKTLPIDWSAENPVELYERTPAANQLLFDLGLHTIKTHITRQSCQELLLWICLSPLDMVGHEFGPQSREVIDMIYHLDCQIEQFMNCVSDYLKRTDVLYVLTADHGVSPIPEIMNEEGYCAAHRINYAEILPDINSVLKKSFGIDDMICNCMSSQIYISDSVWNSLTPEQQKKSIEIVKKKLSPIPGIKKIWTPEELAASWYANDQIESFYKNQMYPGRTGRLIVQPFPYCVPDDWGTGTGHRTPYEPDTHVPLILYQKHNLERRIIYDHVWTLQLAPSLAHILRIQKPSACPFSLLPGLIDYDPITGEVLQTVVV